MTTRFAGSLLCLATCCLCLLHSARVSAQSAGFPISLDYAAVPGCPSANELQGMVVARVGYDPFDEGAQKHVTLRITAQDTGLDGRTEWRDASGKWAGDQSFHTASTDCLRLARTMGLALAVQLQLLADRHDDAEPEALVTSEPAAPSSTAPAAEPPPKVNRTATPENDTKARLPSPTFALGAGASIGFGMSSTPIWFGRAFGVLAWPHLSLQLGPELSTKASTRRADGAGFSQQLGLLSAAGCWLRSPWNACLVFNAGEVRLLGQDIDRPRSARVLVVEAGVRVGFEQPIGSRLFFDAHVDGLILLVRRTATLDETPVWSAPPFAAAMGLDAGLRFP